MFATLLSIIVSDFHSPSEAMFFVISIFILALYIGYPKTRIYGITGLVAYVSIGIGIQWHMLSALVPLFVLLAVLDDNRRGILKN